MLVTTSAPTAQENMLVVRKSKVNHSDPSLGGVSAFSLMIS